MRCLILELLILWVLSSPIVRLYPVVKVQRKSFKDVKRVTVPNQSLSLQEIISRFIRRESLPVSKEGVYEERFGDLEKIAHEDILVQMEWAKEIRAKLANIEARWKKEEVEAAAAALEATKSKVMEPDPGVQGGTPFKSPPLQGS